MSTLAPPTADSLEALRAHLGAFDGRAHRGRDPVHLVHKYRRGADQEVVAFLASMLAFGRVASIQQNVGKILDILGPHPAQGIRAFDATQGREQLGAWVHRWCGAADVVRVLVALRRVLGDHPTLEAFFLQGDDKHAPDTLEAIASFYRRLAAHAGVVGGEPRSRGLEFLLPRGVGPSPYKRGHLFLRWMVRKADGIDLGVWHGVSTHRLLVPLDTHIARIAQNLGATTRRTVDAQMAREVTEWLRRLDPHDPLRYDFALCHIGISGECPSRRQETVCAGCGMRSSCRHWTGSTAAALSVPIVLEPAAKPAVISTGPPAGPPPAKPPARPPAKPPDVVLPRRRSSAPTAPSARTRRTVVD